jgi:uncharacterized protein YbjT (DUF2867 family)
MSNQITQTSTSMRTTHLVVGGTGKTGRRVVDRLHRGGHSVRSLSRPAFDWDDPGTWSSLEAGADTVYLTYAPDVAFPGAPEAVAEVAGRALAAGARRIVLLSGRGEPEAQRAEQLVSRLATDHDAEWAVVRCAFFMQNFSEGFMADAITAGELVFPADTVREPFVDVDDVADVVAGLVLGEVPTGQVYELTGPRLVTFAEATATIAEATGRRIAYVPVSVPDFVAGLLDEGLPRELAHGVGELFAHTLDGHNAHLAGGVRRALGREPRDFLAFARSAAVEGRWAGVPSGAPGPR